jgi:ATP-dependent RNA helicase SUPV3L1/SUV3
MGALSPRTRNAQVDLYQNGDVDFLVATDAIGMGLNLDIHHVAFADDTKFDGHQSRPLTRPSWARSPAAPGGTGIMVPLG